MHNKVCTFKNTFKSVFSLFTKKKKNLLFLITERRVWLNCTETKEERNMHLSLKSPSAMFPLEFTEK